MFSNTCVPIAAQSELYALTSPGGPHYPPRSVQAAALSVLDCLFPANQTTRNILRWVFKVLHPADWLGGALLAPVMWASWAWGKVWVLFGAVCLCTCTCVRAHMLVRKWGRFVGARVWRLRIGTDPTGRGARCGCSPGLRAWVHVCACFCGKVAIGRRASFACTKKGA